MKDDAPTVIFLHVPKAGGTTLAKLLTRWFRPAEIYTVAEQARAEIVAELGARADVRLIVGHAAFGLHEALATPARYVTLLREPVERMISHYHYIGRTPQHRLHAAMKRGEFPLATLAHRFSNLQTRYLSGTMLGDLDPSVLARAKENVVAHFAVAGLADRFDESALLMHRAFGRRLLPFTSENVGPSRTFAAKLEDADRRVLQATNELDYALYDFVRQRFEEQLAAQDESFHRRVRLLRRTNAVVDSAVQSLRRWRFAQ